MAEKTNVVETVLEKPKWFGPVGREFTPGTSAQAVIEVIKAAGKEGIAPKDLAEKALAREEFKRGGKGEGGASTNPLGRVKLIARAALKKGVAEFREGRYYYLYATKPIERGSFPAASKTTLAQRITITIPDNLHERLQAVKDRINVSGICQEAILHAVSAEEIKASDIQNMDSLVAKLGHEIDLTSGHWKEIGIEDAVKDAQNLNFKDFLAVESTWNYSKEGTNLVVGGQIIDHNFHPHMEWLPLKKRFPFLGERAKTYSVEHIDWDQVKYFDGWMEGIVSVWAKVKAKLKEATDQRKEGQSWA
jgi:post-segregation antitoxin (ccd killing protein)